MVKKEREELRREYERLKADGEGAFAESTVKEWLARSGIPVPACAVVSSAREAAEFAGRVSYPVVLKVVGGGVLHKTEMGGVETGIGDERSLKQAFTRMKNVLAGVSRASAGIMLEKQVPPGVEVIVGLQNDPHFGPVLMVGMGGVMTDLLKDVSFRMLPVSKTEVRRMLGSLAGRPLLEGFRGAEPVDLDALVDTIHGIAKFGLEIAPYMESADFNPVIATSSGAIVVDAKVVVAGEILPDPMASESPRTRHMEAFFDPASVAVVGASAGEGKIGNVIVDSLVNYQFAGRIYPINPNRSEILGARCYPSLADLPETPELVVMVVDLERGPSLMKEMGRLGIHNLLIVSGGGKELGGTRERIEGEMAALSREMDIRVIGPNCIGAFDGRSRFDSFFHNHERLARPPAGPMSFITQSGTWGCTFLEGSQAVGVSKMVSYGNRMDVDEGDLIAYLSGDPATRVISSYVEGLSQGRKFLNAAGRAAREGKPVVIFKTGRNATSATAAVSHTGAYGGSYEVYRGVLGQAGVVTVDSFHELFAASKALALQPPAGGTNAAMLSNGAGPMVNALDLFPGKGLELVRLSRKSVRVMRDHFSFFYLVENPVDVTGSATAADYEFVIRTLIEDDRVDIIMPFFVFQDTPLDESIVERMAGLVHLRAKPIVGCAAGGAYTEEMSARLESIGIPVTSDVAQWVAAAGALAQWGAAKGKKR